MIQIDVQSILHNVRELRRILGPKVKLCCVVKGDGYGCGDVRMTRVLEQYADVDMVAVAVLDEARHLRDSGVTLPILVLCDIEDGDARDVVRYDLIPSIYRLEFARRLNAVAEGKRIPVHVRLDVCAGSPGMLGRDFLALLPELLALPNLRLAGLYTQLYGAYIEDRAEMDRQLDRFFGVVDALPEDLQAVVDEAGMEACVWEREYLAEAETAWLDELEAAGMQINYPEKDAFVEATKSVYDEFVGDEAGKVSPELLEKVYEIIGRE